MIDEFTDVSRLAGFAAIEVSIQQALAWAVELGGPESLAHELQRRNIRVVQCSGIIPAGPVLPAPLLCDESTWSRALATLSDRLGVAAAVGCPSAAVVVDAVVQSSYEEAESEGRRRLRVLAERTASFGLHLSVEFLGDAHSRNRPRAKPFVGDMGALAALIRPLAPDRVRMLIDVFHWYLTDPTLTLVEEVEGRIGFVQVSDVPREAEIATLDDSRRMLPGEGVVDFSDVWNKLHLAGYDGPWSLELFSQALWDLEPAAAAGRLFAAGTYLRQIVGVR